MDEQIVKSESRARQGGKGKPVLYVLIASLVLLGIYMVGLMSWSTSTSQSNVSNRSSDAMRETTTGSTTGMGGASSANTGNVPPANPAYPSPATPTANGPAPSSAGPSAIPVTPTPTR